MNVENRNAIIKYYIINESRMTMNSPFIKQLRKGKVKKMGKKGAKDPFEREWESGIFKNPFEDKLWLTKTGLKGDEIADTKVHGGPEKALLDRKSTRLNSSHVAISYAVFCLKKHSTQATR